MTTMLQLNPYIWVTTPLGDGLAMLIIDYGLDHNTTWVVALAEDGQVKHFESNTIKMRINHTYGIATKRGAKKE